MLGKKFSAGPDVSRKVSRRNQVKSHRLQWFHEGVAALNSIAGYSGEGPDRPSAVLKSCLSQLEKRYFETGKPPVGLSSEGALKELLGKCTSYFERTDLVSYDPALLALPEAGSRLSLANHLMAEHRPFVDDSQQHLLMNNDCD